VEALYIFLSKENEMTKLQRGHIVAVTIKTIQREKTITILQFQENMK